MKSQLNTFPIPMDRTRSSELTIPVIMLPAVADEAWDTELINWPTVVHKSEFEIRVFDDGRKPIDPILRVGDGITRRRPLFDSTMWPSIFDAQRVVFTQESNAVPGAVLSFDANALTDGQQYRMVKSAISLSVEPEESKRLSGLFTISQAEAQATIDHADFFKSLSRSPENMQRAEVPKPIDFHNTLHACLEEPTFARAVGLIEDFELQWDDRFPASGYIFVYATDGPLTGARFAGTAIAYELITSNKTLRLYPRHDQTKQSRGMAQIRSSVAGADPFTFQTHDLDGTRFKLDLAGADNSGVLPDLRPQAKATMRSPGISIIDSRAADRVKQSIAFSARELTERLTILHTVVTETTNEVRPASWFDGEDLSVGFRFDVKTRGKRHSLYRRRLVHEPTNTLKTFERQKSDDTEGFSEPVLTTTTDKNGSNPQNQSHPVIALWDGWSLSVPKPQITDVKKPISTEEAFNLSVSLPRRTVNRGDEVREESAADLPKLRYGQKYVFSARNVYMGGFGIPVEDVTEAINALGELYQSDEVAFDRAEAVPSPFVVFDKTDGRANKEVDEAIKRNVGVSDDKKEPTKKPSRSNLYVTLDKPIARKRVRWIYPPETELPMAEYAGAIDEYSVDALQQFDLLKDRVPGRPPTYDRPDIRYLPDPWASIADVSVRLLTRDRERAYSADSGKDRKEYLVNLEGVTWSRAIPFYKRKARWPDATPFPIEVIATNSALSYVVASEELDAGERIRVYVADGDQLAILVSSRVDTKNSEHFLLTNWIKSVRARTAESDLIKLCDTTLRKISTHPMLVPSAVLHAIHAVREPKQSPKISNPTLTQAPGESVAAFVDTLYVDGASVGELRLEAEWKETKDDPNDGPPVEVSKSAVSQNVGVNSTDLVRTIGGSEIELMTDTRAKSMTARIIGDSRFANYFGEKSAAHVRSEPFLLNHKNTAVPAPAKIAYTIPLFDWQRGKPDRRSLRSNRLGQLFRVYLERPWRLTGEDEMLGVVCWPDAFKEISPELRDALRPYVSHWGREPLLSTAGLEDGPFLDHFLDTDDMGSGMSLAEFSDPALEVSSFISERRVAVAGYRPLYDEEKNLWYADIRIRSQQAYLPWVRLALVRWQPNSVEGAELSTASTELHFTQLQPDRILSITRHSMDSNTLSVRLSGPSGIGDSGDQSLTTPAVSVVVQKQRYSESDVWDDLDISRKELTRTPSLGSSGAWFGSIRIHSDMADTNHRLCVREVIRAPSDAMHIHDGSPNRSPTNSRTLYVEHVPIDLVFAARLNSKRRAS